MSSRFLKNLLFFFLSIAIVEGRSQSCTIVPSAYKVCLGSAVGFVVNSNGTVIKSLWTFGDGATDTLFTVAHIYKNPGNYTVTVIVTFSNNTTCTTTVSQPIKVFDLPKADFTISQDTLCIVTPLCLNNTSTKGSSGAPIRKVTFLFGDGAIVYNQNSPCHTYTKTGNFIVTLEVEDTNGCISRMEKAVVVTEMNISFLYTLLACSVVRFLNTSNYVYTNVKRYYWDFGDGTYDSSAANYYNVTHTFPKSVNCPVTIRLFVQSVYGCSDTKFITLCPFYKFTVNITHDKKKMCFRNNIFNFANPVNPGAVMVWAYKLEGTTNLSHSVYGSVAQYSFPECGRFIVALTMRVGVCDTTAYDTVDVQGPFAKIEKDTVPPYNVINRFQCVPDTAYFVSPTLYQSKHCSASVKRLWDFGDLKCPQCTTDTKNGINANTNCRWSKDSISVKHKYMDTGCINVRLLLWDTITGCIDSDHVMMVIGKPDLKKIKVTGGNCLGSVQHVDLSALSPYCDIQEFWFNKDTICFQNIFTSWIRLTRNNFNYVINSTCNGDSSVTGFAVKNGKCYDTLFLVKHFPKLHPRFYLTNINGCAPLTTTACIVDSFQFNCFKAVWDWGDGTKTIDSPILNGFVKSQTHTFSKNILYPIQLQLFDSSISSGCVFDTVYYLGVGIHLEITDTISCNNKFVNFGPGAWYFNNPINMFNPYKPFTGRLRWYYGDGTTDTINSHTYAKAGKYKVKLVAFDSNGCIDSTEKIISVNEIHVGFTWNPKILVCGQIVQFYDSSYVKDSSGVIPRDSIISWLWDFGDQRAKSTLKNPAHAYFVNGDFYVKLVVETVKGCKDSVIIKISISGPVPMFELLSDSVGCVPFTVTLRNISTNCDQNIIYMGDPSNSSFKLGVTDTVNFTYSKPGIYYIYLFGEASFKNPNTGSNVYCSSWYPDKSNPNARLIRIVVLPRPPVKFVSADTICVNKPLTIINLSDTIYNKFIWLYGDSSTETKLEPDSNTIHTYTKTGVYFITLKPDYIPQGNIKECPDTFTKKIVVVDLNAAFTMDLKNDPLVKFNNQSVGGQTYLWNFGHPNSGSKNFSRAVNPEHDFLNDTGLFTICLTAYNTYGCEDSVCQVYYNSNYRLLIIPNVFTINGDGINDAFDIDIHGEILYDLTIYNRWGGIVYTSQVDGTGNDSINWNGKISNKGTECPSGVYYFKFNYQFRGEEIKTYKGVVTLIR